MKGPKEPEKFQNGSFEGVDENSHWVTNAKQCEGLNNQPPEHFDKVFFHSWAFTLEAKFSTFMYIDHYQLRINSALTTAPPQRYTKYSRNIP